MRIFVFEFFSGGGSAQYPVSNSILSEGYAMLNSIIADFSKTDHQIISSLDYRVNRFKPPIHASEIFEISNQDNFNDKFNEILFEDIDAFFIVAPEIDNILFNLVKKVEEVGITILGPSSESIMITSDKYQTIESVIDTAIIPKTKIASIDSTKEEIILIAQMIISSSLMTISLYNVGSITKRDAVLQLDKMLEIIKNGVKR